MNIYIPEHIPSENKGEEAILQGIHQGLKEQVEEVSIAIFSNTPEIDRINYGKQFEIIDGITFRPAPGKPVFSRISETIIIWFKHFSFLLMWYLLGKKCFYFFRGGNWKAYIDADVILVGHDGVFSDLNIIFALFVKGIGKKSAIFGCGFKNFRFKLTEKLARTIIPMIDVVVLREERSYNYLLSIGIPESKIHQKPDPAFLMEPAPKNMIEELLKKEGIENNKCPIIGMIAVKETSYYPFFYGYGLGHTARYEKHVSFFAELTEKIADTTKGTIVFVPHDLRDIIIAKDIKSKMKTNAKNVLIIENEYSAPVLKGFIQHLDFLISQRLHAVIGAVTAGTPFIMVTVREDGRSHNIVEKTIGKPGLIFDINEPDIDAFFVHFKKKWAEKNEIGEYLLARARLIRQKCRVAFRMLNNIV